MTRHRHLSFSVQSQRYTGNKINNFYSGVENFDGGIINKKIENLFYFRPSAEYIDRHGNKYKYTSKQRKDDICSTLLAIDKYIKLTEKQHFALNTLEIFYLKIYDRIL